MSAAPSYKLQPLSIGELLDRAIRLYRRNFLTLVGIVALVQIPLTLVNLVASLASFTDQTALANDPFMAFQDNWLGTLIIFLTGIASFLLVQGLATAAVTRAVADEYLGQKVDWFDSYRKIGNSWLSLVGALLWAGVISLGLLIWFLIPCIGWFTGLGIIFFFSSVIVPMLAPVIVLERQPASQAWRRAWSLTRRRFWWVLGFVFILFLFNQLLITGPTALAGVLLQVVTGGPLEAMNSPSTYMLQTIVQTAVTLFFSLVYIPLQLTAITLMYFDLRVRTEGFDLAVLAQSMAVDTGGDMGDVTAVAAQVPVSRGENLVTSNELGYFVVVSIAGALLSFLLAGVLGLLGAGMMAAGGGL
jgi:hypothetical protein